MGAGPRSLLTVMLSVCCCIAFASPGASGAQSEHINVDFWFSPGKNAYCPGEDFSVGFLVVNMVQSGDLHWGPYEYMVKVTNVSARFSWMAPNEWAWNDVSSHSSWLAPDGGGSEVYAVNLSVPSDAEPLTYTYSFRIAYMVNTYWGNVSYNWTSGVTYRDFDVASPDQPGETGPALVDFTFVPAKASYAPGEEFSIDVTVVNSAPSGDYEYDTLAYMLKVTEVGVRFSWMGPNEWCVRNVSEESSWLEPDGLGSEAYALGLSVPVGAEDQTYSYHLRVAYLVHTYWGNLSYLWTSSITYRDFVVSGDGASVDYLPALVAIALVVSVGALGAAMYHRHDRGRGRPAGPARTAASAAPRGAEACAVMRPLPGEPPEVERGFIYLVKEARPDVAFSMYDGAVAGGAKGMVVSREHPNRLREAHEFEAESIVWLSRKAGKNHVDPTELSLVSLRMTKFVESHERSVLLLEGVEYLITQNDFETVLRFVNHLHDFVMAFDCAVVMMVDPRVLNTRELALLERSAKVVEPQGADEGAPGPEGATS